MVDTPGSEIPLEVTVGGIDKAIGQAEGLGSSIGKVVSKTDDLSAKASAAAAELSKALGEINKLAESAPRMLSAFAGLANIFEKPTNDLKELSRQAATLRTGGTDAARVNASAQGAKNMEMAKPINTMANLDNFEAQLTRSLGKALENALGGALNSSMSGIMRQAEISARRMSEMALPGVARYQSMGTGMGASVGSESSLENLKAMRIAAEANMSSTLGRAGEMTGVTSDAEIMEVARLVKESEDYAQILAQIKIRTEEVTAAERERAAAAKATLDAETKAAQSRKESAAHTMQAAMERDAYIAKQNKVDGEAPSRMDRFTTHANNMVDWAMMGMLVGSPLETIKQVSDLDKSFGELQAITQSSNTQMTSLRDTISGVAKASNQSAVEIVEATTIMAKFGMTADQVRDSLKDVTDFASATRIKPHESATMLTGVMGAYNMPSTGMSQISDLVTGTVSKSRITSEALNSGLNMTAEVAAEVNIPLKELVGTMALAADAGVRMNERFGTGFRQMVQSISEPSDQLKMDLSKVGLNAESVDVRTKGLVAVLQTMHDAGFDASMAMRNLGTEGAAFYNALGKNISTANEFIGSLGQTGSAAAAAARNADTLSGSFTRLKNTWDTVMYSAGESSFTGLLKGMANFAATLVGAVGLSKTLSGVIATMATGAGIAGLVALLGTGAAVGPILAAAATLAAVVAAATNLPKNSTVDKLDAANGRVADLKARTEQNEKLNSSIDDSISHLASHGDEIKNSAEVIDELRGAYGKLGLQVDVTSNKTSDYIDLLTAFRDKIATRNIGDITQQIDALKTQAQLRKQNILESGGANPNDSMYPEYTSRGGKAYTGGAVSEANMLFGALRTGNSFTPETLNRLYEVQAKLGDQKAGTSSTDKEAQDGITKSMGEVATAIGQLTEILGSKEAVDVLDKQRRGLEASIQPGSIYKDASSAMSLAAMTDGALKNIQGMSVNANDDEAQAALAQDRKEAISAIFLEPMARIQKYLEQNPNGDEAADAAKMLANMKAMISKVTGAADEVTTKHLQYIEAGIRADVTDLENQKRDLSAQLTQAKTNEEVARLAAAIDDVIKKIFDKKIELISNDPTIDPKLNPSVNPKVKQSQVNSATSGLTADEQAAKNAAENRRKSIESTAQSEQLTQDNSYLNLYRTELTTAQAIAGDKYSTRASVESSFKTMANLIQKVFDAQVKVVMDEAARLTDPAAKENTQKAGILAAQSARQASLNQLRDAQEKYKTPVDQFGVYSKQFTEGQGSISDTFANASIAPQRTIAGLQLQMIGATGSDRQGLREQIQQAQINQFKDLVEAARAAEVSSLGLSKGSLDEASSLQARAGAIPVDANGNTLVVGDQEKLTKLTEEISAAKKNALAADKEAVGYQKQQLDYAQKLKDAQEAVTQKTVAGSIGQGAKDWQKANNTSVYEDLRAGVPNVLNASTSAFSSFFTNIESGSMKVKNAFRSMATSILQSMQQVLTNSLAKSLLGGVIGMIGGSGGGGSVPAGFMNDSALTFWGGGTVPAHRGLRHFSLGGGSGISTRDSVPALLAPGEVVMRQSAVSLLGEDNLNNLNSMGNSRVSNSARIPANNNGPVHSTNVWVVSQDQVPPPGERDIVAMVSNNMRTGGVLKSLVKSIQTGGM